MRFQLGLALVLPLVLLPQADRDSWHEFDFWLGEWSVNNRYLQEDGSWKDGGEARARITPVLDGRAVFEEWRGEGEKASLFGMSLRAYDAERQGWTLLLNWPNATSASFGTLRGSFRHGRGEFFAGSGPQLTRYSFSDALADSVRWDSARTTDGGQHWRTDWIMEFTRTAPAATNAQALFDAPWMEEHIVELEAARELDFLQGTWTGVQREERSDGAVTEHPASLRATVFLKGWAVLESLQVGPADAPLRERLTVRGYVPAGGRWESWSLTRDDTRFERSAGPVEHGEGQFEGRGPRGTFTEHVLLNADESLVIEEERTLNGGATVLTTTELRLQ